MQVYTFRGYWKVSDVRENVNYIFVYGDNDVQCGTGGQAIIRHEKNTHGIPTKKCPNNKESSFYNDGEFTENKTKIKNAIKMLLDRLENGDYSGIFLPENGLGTGLADLPKRAPKTFKFLNEQIEKLKEHVLNIKK